MIAGIFGGSGFVAPCTRVLSNSDLSRRFVHRTSDRSRSEVLCTHGGQPSELVQSPSENDTSRSEVVGEHDGALKIRLSAPPVDGAANTELCAFLAKQFGTSKTQVEIETGHTSRRKRVRVRGASRRPDFAG